LFLNLKRDNTNVASYYKIDSEPEAIYTNGPISLGMVESTSMIELPTPISKQQPLLPFLGISIKNKDPYGSVEKINKITFRVPDPIELDTDNCQPRKAGIEYKGKSNGYSNYSSTYFLEYPSDAPYITIRCPLKLKQGSTTGELLGPGSISLNTFVVFAEYDYVLTRSTSITIEEGPEIN
jgi:hypothetical protein